MIGAVIGRIWIWIWRRGVGEVLRKWIEKVSGLGFSWIGESEN